MIEFPQDGQISIADLKAFIEAKLGEGTAPDQNLRNLFATMEQAGFQLPNGEVDQNGVSQAFVAPHKMSETYGGQAPITEEGIDYGDHELEVTIIRNLHLWPTIREKLDAPISMLVSQNSDRFLQDLVLFLVSNHKINVPFGNDGLFLVDANGDPVLGDWVLNNSNVGGVSGLKTSITGLFNLIQINCQSASAGIYIEFEVEPGEIYYFEAYNYYNAKILIGNSINDSFYGDSDVDMNNAGGSVGSVAPYTYYVPTQSKIYISIIPSDPANLFFFVGLIRTYKYYQHGENRYPELELEIHKGLRPNDTINLPLPRMDVNNIGFSDTDSFGSHSESGSKYYAISEGEIVFDQETISANENNYGDFYFDTQTNINSTYNGYDHMDKTRLLATIDLVGEGGFQSYASVQKYGGLVYVPVKHSGEHAGNGAIVNVNVTFKKSHNYYIYYSPLNNKWLIVDQEFSLPSPTLDHIFDTKQQALDYWETNYNQEGEFYTSSSANKLFDWIHLIKSEFFLPIDSALDMIYLSKVYPVSYLQWLNYHKPSKQLTGTIKLTAYRDYIQGSGTIFSLELNEGDVIVVGSNNYIVKAIMSDNFVTITQTAYSTTSYISANYITRNYGTYPHHTAFPQHGYTNTNLQINGFYNVNINPEQQTQVDLAISKLESIIENSIDMNMFFVPYDDARSGGILAAARAIQENSIPNQLYKNPNYSQIYLKNFGNVAGAYQSPDSLNGCYVYDVSSSWIKIKSTSSSNSYRGVARFSLGYLDVGEFYKLKFKVSSGDLIMVSVRTDQNNETYAHRILDDMSGQAVFSFQAKDGYNYFEISIIEHLDFDVLLGDAYINEGSNTVTTTTDPSVYLSSGDTILINGQIVTVNSVDASSITINSNYPYDAFAATIYKLSPLSQEREFTLYSVQVDKINATYVRDQIQSGVIFIDQIDFGSQDANFILADGKSGLYYVLLHELLHAVGIGSYYWKQYELSDGVGYYSYPSQYNGIYGTIRYKEIIQEKINQLSLPKILADYYTDSVPAQGGSAHIAEYAKLVNGKVQPSLVNELMSPQYDFDRGILSKITFGFLEDLGYEVDYNQIESSFLLEMSENTDISSDPGSSNYDKITYQKKIRRCPHCESSHIDEIKDTILPDRASE